MVTDDSLLLPQVIKKDLKSLENFTQHQFTFTPDSSDEVKISINFGSKSASKGWQLTLASDTSEVSQSFQRLKVLV